MEYCPLRAGGDIHKKPVIQVISRERALAHAREKGESIGAFLPFLYEDDVRELALQALEKGERIECFLPYMAEDDVKELTIKMLKNKW